MADRILLVRSRLLPAGGACHSCIGEANFPTSPEPATSTRSDLVKTVSERLYPNPQRTVLRAFHVTSPENEGVADGRTAQIIRRVLATRVIISPRGIGEGHVWSVNIQERNPRSSVRPCETGR
ncbi:hypothetical protein [uncultured Sphingomonas sp.]|uniref:hypothetical protein n=1 Tax=uncultured Sphingomonas sp. TaxID=158754 RepID=UPI0035CB6BE5